jgi:hypothetical protein
MFYDKFMKFIRMNYFYKDHTNNQEDNIKFFELLVGPEYFL